MFGLLVILFVFTISDFVFANNYCNLASCEGRQHTMCMYRSNAVSPACTYLQSAKLTLQEKNLILKLHNDYRRLVASGREGRGMPGPQPPAKQMPLIKWDNELEIIAQTWANQCTFGHDSCKNVGRFKVGQNVAQIWNTDSQAVNITGLIKLWSDEVALYNPSLLLNYRSNKRTGHYTQLLWANSTYMGCGLVKYYDIQKIANRLAYTQYIVCNYGPAGNVIGHPVYIPRRISRRSYKSDIDAKTSIRAEGVDSPSQKNNDQLPENDQIEPSDDRSAEESFESDEDDFEFDDENDDFDPDFKKNEEENDMKDNGNDNRRNGENMEQRNDNRRNGENNEQRNDNRNDNRRVDENIEKKNDNYNNIFA